jgi:hypothetical protein
MSNKGTKPQPEGKGRKSATRSRKPMSAPDLAKLIELAGRYGPSILALVQEVVDSFKSRPMQATGLAVDQLPADVKDQLCSLLEEESAGLVQTLRAHLNLRAQLEESGDEPAPEPEPDPDNSAV